MAAKNSDKKFLLACVDPFHPTSKGAFLPSGSATASYKTSAVIRTDGQLDSNGNGVIMFNPSVCNDATCLWYQAIGNGADNDLTFPFNTNIVPTSSTDFVYNFQNPALNCSAAKALPFGIADLIGGSSFVPGDSNTGNPVSGAPDVRGRVVSVGLKLTFSGTTLNDGGVIYALVEPTHDSLQFRNLSQSLAQYTSTKVQRMALRDTVELVAFPTTRAQQEFSNAYDDLVINLAAGVSPVTTSKGSGVCGFAIASNQLCINGGAAGLKQSSGNGQPASSTFSSVACWPCPNVDRALISTVYPLSRRNSQKFRRAYSIGTAAVTDSVVTFAGNAPKQAFLGSAVSIAGTNADFVLAQSGDNYYVIDPVIGMPSYTFDLTTAGAMTGYCDIVTPPPIGCIAIQGGDSMAGQTYHIEYIVHVEYSGIGVQGRTSANVPNEHVMDLTLSAVDHARETSGQHENASLKDVALHCIEHVAAKHAPELVSAAADIIGATCGGPIGGAFGGIVGGLVGQALKRKKH